jgi:hypothetical protein
VPIGGHQSAIICRLTASRPALTRRLECYGCLRRILARSLFAHNEVDERATPEIVGDFARERL